MKRKQFRRSIVINKDKSAGEIIKAEDLVFKRPGTHIEPCEMKYVVGRKLNCDVKADTVLNWNMLL